jgi:hypothetical protein
MHQNSFRQRGAAKALSRQLWDPNMGSIAGKLQKSPPILYLISLKLPEKLFLFIR